MEIFKKIDYSISLDEAQIFLIEELEKILADWSKFRLILKPKFMGVYLYGPVGRGKTVICKAFFDSLKKKKSYYHYQEFIRIIHEESHELFLKGIKENIETISKKFARNNEVIFIDELEIRDISDAMLIRRLFENLIKKKIFLVITSNIKPSNLYKDGIQREQFLPTIDLIEKNFYIHNLDNSIDYRFTKISSGKNLILENAKHGNNLIFEELENTLTHNKDYKRKVFYLFGREVIFDKYYEGVISLELNDIIKRELSYNDFLTISKEVKSVILKSSDKFIEDSNQVIRFINFIDNLYASKVMLVAFFAFPIKELYIGKKYEKEFNRALSRIAEMNGIEYIEHSKYYRKNDG